MLKEVAMSRNRRDSKKNTGSGHAAMGMGGDPNDDPRDQNSGGKRMDEDRDTKGSPVPGAFGTEKPKSKRTRSGLSLRPASRYLGEIRKFFRD
jgi:hypothetical protein